MEEAENRIARPEDNMEELDWSSKDYEKLKKTTTTQEWNNQELWGTMIRANLCNIGLEEEEDSQNNGIAHIFNRIVKENFSKLKKKYPYKYKKHIEHQVDRTRKEIPHIISQ